jgi:hypothetical protein
MTVKRMDNVLIVVDDLEAMKRPLSGALNRRSSHDAKYDIRSAQPKHDARRTKCNASGAVRRTKYRVRSIKCCWRSEQLRAASRYDDQNKRSFANYAYRRIAVVAEDDAQVPRGDMPVEQ